MGLGVASPYRWKHHLFYLGSKSLRKISMKNFTNVYVIDGGKNAITVYQPSLDEQNFDDLDENGKLIFHEPVKGSYLSLSYKDFLQYKFEPGSLVIGENAHFGAERTKRSLAQPFDGDPLLDFYARLEENNVTLKLFAERSTPRANEYSGHTKVNHKTTDQADCKSIFIYLKDHEEKRKSLKNPPSNFDQSDIRDEGYDRKDKLNIHLNKARRFDYKDRNDMVTKLIHEHIDKIASKLSPEAREAFRLEERCKSGKRAGQFKNIAMTQIYTVASTMIEQNGELKLYNNGKLDTWGFVQKNLMTNSEFHHRGGVARSNIYYHGVRNYVAKKLNNKVTNKNNRKVLKKKCDYSAEENKRFNFYRNQYTNRYLKQLFNTIKEVLIDGHKDT